MRTTGINLRRSLLATGLLIAAGPAFAQGSNPGSAAWGTPASSQPAGQGSVPAAAAPAAPAQRQAVTTPATPAGQGSSPTAAPTGPAGAPRPGLTAPATPANPGGQAAPQQATSQPQRPTIPERHGAAPQPAPGTAASARSN
ncbi:hypothetical protein [Roseicella aerolata]|uniref:Translation initiation factor IF-2 n=1 Tax=Roseicella aerolata TaxID=2883479 RepID=A0A9X1ICP4_9PROT|nr:hypothetical protein [Roseicella aerolata]MCB4820610.1 hypothetical protein [Roseicella aerolata]